MRHDFVLQLLYRIRRKIFLKSSGMLSSFSKGDGFDFAELLPYTEGMDTRRIYWNSLAKGGELQLKSFYEEKEINVCVGVITGGTLLFGAPVQKFEKLLEIVTILGYSIVQSKNLFQGFLWNEHESFVEMPSKKVHGVESFIKSIAKIDPLYHSINPTEVTDMLHTKVRKKSLLFLVGDFLEMYDLKKLAKKHEIIIIRVRDRFEKQSIPMGEGVFIDPETGEEIEILFDEATAKAYTQRYRDHDRAFEHYITKMGIRYMTIYTDEDALLKLARL